MRRQPVFPYRLMRVVSILAVAAAVVFPVWAAEPDPNPTVVKVGKHQFTIPNGFEITLAAGPPLVDRPIVADYDEAGHLYVADSAGVNDRPEKQLKDRPHRIVRLTDVDGDGVYDKSTVFADKMMFPEGLLWHDGAVYCAAPPSIWKLEDTDDDGVADKRTEWFDVGTLTGCANDLHGPYLGPAGWLYWTKGAFAKLDLKMADGSQVTDPAAHIFRARPDGSGLESFAAGGMDNPVDVSFGETGEVFFSSTFLVRPANGQRDGLLHGIYGSVYPKRHGVIDSLPRTGELMPAMTHLGPSASCGLTTYRSEAFGSEYRQNLFSCLFNMRKVMRHRLVPSGSSYRTEDSDFVVSDQVDFHPTDVQEDADGSLLILDTGGWYKLCCPTSVIAKPEVLGAVYRVRRKGGKSLSDPRGLKIAWNKLDLAGHIALLQDARPKVRERAIAHLGKRGSEALEVLRESLQQSKNEAQALGAVWALARMRTSESRAVVRTALSHPLSSVQRAGAYVCGLERDEKSLEELASLLHVKSLAVRREAATALGRLGKKEACRHLMASPPSNDRWLEHALTYALIEINDPAELRKHRLRVEESGKVVGQSSMRMFWALDAMANGALHAEEVIALLGNDTPVVPILERHPEWGTKLAAYYERFLRSSKVLGEREGRIDHCLNEFLHWPEVGKMVSDLLLEGTLHEAGLRHLGDIERPHALPDTLIPGLQSAMMDGQLGYTPLVRQMQAGQMTPEFESWLIVRAEEGTRWAGEVLASCKRPLPQAAFQRRLEHIGTRERLLNTGQLLSLAKLSEEQKLELIEALPRAGVVELEALLKVFEGGGSEAIGIRLADALKKAPASRNVSQDTFKKLAAAFPKSVRAVLLAARPASPVQAELAERLETLNKTLPKGDRIKGHQVFRSSKAACNSCHRIAYEGGTVGPDLTRIGAIRSRRDLLEAIVVPSASYARGYEPVLITHTSGEANLGVVTRTHPERLYLRDATGREIEVLRDEIKSMVRSPISIMPLGLDQSLSEVEFADLIAFLESLK